MHATVRAEGLMVAKLQIFSLFFQYRYIKKCTDQCSHPHYISHSPPLVWPHVFGLLMCFSEWNILSRLTGAYTWLRIKGCKIMKMQKRNQYISIQYRYFHDVWFDLGSYWKAVGLKINCLTIKFTNCSNEKNWILA